MNKPGKIIGTSILLGIVSLLFFYKSSYANDCKTTRVVEKNGDVVWYFECDISFDNPSQTPEPTHAPVEPSPYPSPSQSSLLPEPSVLPSVTLLPTPIVPSETIPPIIEPTISSSIAQEVNYVTLDNGVELTEEEATQVVLLQSASNLAKKIFTNPKEAFKALGSIGKDMPPEKRKKAQQVVFPVVIVSSIVTSANNLLIRGRVR